MRVMRSGRVRHAFWRAPNSEPGRILVFLLGGDAVGVVCVVSSGIMCLVFSFLIASENMTLKCN